MGKQGQLIIGTMRHTLSKLWKRNIQMMDEKRNSGAREQGWRHKRRKRKGFLFESGNNLICLKGKIKRFTGMFSWRRGGRNKKRARWSGMGNMTRRRWLCSC